MCSYLWLTDWISTWELQEARLPASTLQFKKLHKQPVATGSAGVCSSWSLPYLTLAINVGLRTLNKRIQQNVLLMFFVLLTRFSWIFIFYFFYIYHDRPWFLHSACNSPHNKDVFAAQILKLLNGATPYSHTFAVIHSRVITRSESGLWGTPGALCPPIQRQGVIQWPRLWIHFYLLTAVIRLNYLEDKCFRMCRGFICLSDMQKITLVKVPC